jgi:sorting nexin-13
MYTIIWSQFSVEVHEFFFFFRDMVDLIGNHLDMFRKNQSLIGVDVMGTLSSEERDERLKQHLLVSQELHPALLSSEHEYKVRTNTF